MEKWGLIFEAFILQLQSTNLNKENSMKKIELTINKQYFLNSKSAIALLDYRLYHKYMPTRI